MEAARLRYCAAERAIGPPEDALFWAKHELKEARFDLDWYEKERGRQDACLAEAKAKLAEQEAAVCRAEKWAAFQARLDDHFLNYTPLSRADQYLALKQAGLVCRGTGDDEV